MPILVDAHGLPTWQITGNTVEEKIVAMQDKKRAPAEGIYKDGDKEESLKLTAEDLTALFEPLT